MTIRKHIQELEDILEGVTSPETTTLTHPEHVLLFGGISGLGTEVSEALLCEGLIIRQTYAHVMAPYLMAFERPKRPGAPHPAPWKAARGRLGFDILVEIALAQSSRPTGLDRLNTLWWMLALLRLVTAAHLRMPVVSDMAFATISDSDREPNLWTIEMPPHQFRTERDLPKAITISHINWLRSNLIEGAHLLEIPAFNRAFQTFDGAIWAHSASSAIIMVWAALETLLRPGRYQTTKT